MSVHERTQEQDEGYLSMGGYDSMGVGEYGVGIIVYA